MSSTQTRSKKGGSPVTPKVIRTESQYEATLARIDAIFDAEPGTHEGDELELLALLVENYEEEAYPIGLPDPVSAIRFRMDQQGLKPKDLIPFIGSKSKVSEVLGGQRPLSLTMIRKLVTHLGIPAESLLQLSGATLGPSDFAELGKRMPLAAMHKRGYFRDFVGSLHELKGQIEDVLEAFAAPAGKNAALPALHRQMVRTGSQSDEPALIAWRIRVVSEALREALPAYRPGSVTAGFLAEVARLSYFDDGPRLAREYLNKAGIHLVVERHLPKTYLDGAALRLPDGSRLVALTLRHDRLDNFWFTLLHELAHLALHLDGPDLEAIFDDLDSASTEAREQEADAMASEALIPAKAWKASGLSADHSEARVKAFAERLRIHPSIPAGRVRHEHKNYRLLNDLVGRGQVRRLLEGDSR